MLSCCDRTIIWPVLQKSYAGACGLLSDRGKCRWVPMHQRDAQIIPNRVGKQKLALSSFFISYVRNNSIFYVGYMLSWTGIVLFFLICLVY